MKLNNIIVLLDIHLWGICCHFSSFPCLCLPSTLVLVAPVWSPVDCKGSILNNEQMRNFQNLKNFFLSSRKIGVEKITKAIRLGRVEREREKNWMSCYSFGFLWARELLLLWTSNCNRGMFMIRIKRSGMPWRNCFPGSPYKFPGILKSCVLY